ncbi:type II toxin-antitoxin system HigB family toxin [Thalassobacterium maritimum]|uniref:type II toxin-antitoxin system HigB family toxin n=1 Tax=Thalassobacterium maritimum TaxID=3041265 RepID=UPI003CE479C4
MRVITKVRLLELAAAHADSVPTVKQWLSTVESALWSNFSDIRKTYNSADILRLNSGRTVYIFNLRSDRLIAAIHFTPASPSRGRVYVREFLTHAAYDKNTWKERN